MKVFEPELVKQKRLCQMANALCNLRLRLLNTERESPGKIQFSLCLYLEFKKFKEIFIFQNDLKKTYSLKQDSRSFWQRTLQAKEVVCIFKENETRLKVDFHYRINFTSVTLVYLTGFKCVNEIQEIVWTACVKRKSWTTLSTSQCKSTSSCFGMMSLLFTFTSKSSNAIALYRLVCLTHFELDFQLRFKVVFC